MRGKDQCLFCGFHDDLRKTLATVTKERDELKEALTRVSQNIRNITSTPGFPKV